ncbi:MAG TPA: sulfatase-like hydrolase/transferase, partial [Vicinamibacteria bacterium]
GRPEEPFFLYLHATDPHDPYTFSPGGRESLGSTDFMEALEAGEIPRDASTREKLLDLYDEKIRYLDRELGRFLDALRRTGLYESSLVVLVSDHGEEFEEHGWWRHGKTLYQEQLHVPFLIKWPGKAPAGKRIGAVVQHVDLVPTVLDFLGGRVEDDLPGRSLWRLPESGSAIDPVVSSYLRSDGREVESVVYRDRKLLRTSVYDRDLPAFALFDLGKDRGETRNLLEREPVAFELLDSLLLRPIPGGELTPLPAAIDESTRKRLEALGYIR